MITYPTGVTIRYADRADAFKGAVESSSARCTRRREVTVFKERAGRDRAIGFDRTNDRGRYSVGYGGRLRGRFYAVAAKKEFADAEGNRVVCSRGRSRTIRP